METESKPQSIRPALDTLRELDNGTFLDKLAAAIHEATGAVTTMQRPASIRITLDFATLTKANLTEPVITVESEITAKLPRPEGHRALFYVDPQGNPTTQQQRQRELGLSVAAAGTTGTTGTREVA